MGGFNGKLGPVVGYMWNGVWCMRGHNPYPHNPRTAKQVAHREMFKQEVQLAANMRWAVITGMRDIAREAHMTPYNLFVKVNQPAFSLDNNRLQVDYSALTLSLGTLPQVEPGAMEWTADNVLNVSFGRGGGRSTDYVYLYVYVPELESGTLAAPVYRRDKSLSISLPDAFAGHEVQLYGYVFDRMGRFSPTIYAGCIVVEPSAHDTETVETEPVATPSAPLNATAEVAALIEKL